MVNLTFFYQAGIFIANASKKQIKRKDSICVCLGEASYKEQGNHTFE